MALVHASDTASLRSSMRSSCSCRRADANDATTSRTNATNSAEAGISSWSTRFTPSAGGGCVDRIVDGEGLGQTGDFEHLQDAGLSADEGEVAVMAAEPLEPADQDAQTGGIEEVDGFEVNHDLVLALAHQL